MRLWSLHPRYLDARGLVACWRESLLAKAVLSGRTRGYKRHPQLERFRALPQPVSAMNQYLSGLFEEARSRGYAFDRKKIGRAGRKISMTVTSGQARYEMRHLKRKLRRRDRRRYNSFRHIETPELHPLFQLIEGDIEQWEHPF